MLEAAVGSLADWLRQLAQGVDERPVVSEHDPKSSGSENTFASDLLNLEEIRGHIAGMARDAAAWLARRELYARTVTIKVRYDDFTTVTRSHSEVATRDEASIVSRAVALLEKTEAGRRPVRLLGASVSNLCATLQPLVVREPRLPFDEIVNHES
jgi:DNA polymerase-4